MTVTRATSAQQHQPSVTIDQLRSGAAGGDAAAAEWAWEAPAGPGPTDPFREDWAAGWDSD